jgi:signal transduction histidine kinase
MELSVAIGNYAPGQGDAVIRERLALAESRRRALFHQRLVDGTLILVAQEPLADGGTVLTYTDATDQERREAELRLAKVLAEEASQTKSDFLAKMSHELRTPLNAIIGFSEALLIDLWGPLNDRQRDYVTDIWSSGAHLLAIINDILDLSKIESGREEIDDEEVDLGEILAECLRLLAPSIERQHLAVESGITAGLPLLRGDRRRLKQIFLNITGNAVKFTGEGGTVAICAGLDAAGWLECAVTDTGIGIAAEHQGHVFEPFFQVESPLARTFKGTGLGLALAKGLVELHGGGLAIASREEVGTTVTVRLPPERLVAR